MAKEKENNAAANPQSEKLKALQAAMSKIEKDFGKGSIMKLGDEHRECGGYSYRKYQSERCTRRGRLSSWTHHRDIWSGVIW